MELWHQTKQNLQPVQAFWEAARPGMLEDSHPVLDRLNLQRLEFLAANKVLKNKTFNFSRWCRRQYDGWGYKPTAFYNGFPNAAGALCPTLPEWDSFSKEWAWDRDLISKPLLA